MSSVGPIDPLSLVGRLGSTVQEAVALAKQVGVTGRNVAEYARHGGLRVDKESSPFEAVARRPGFTLRRYFPDEIPQGLPSLLLVPPLMMMADVYDVAPRSSSVRAVHEAGIDVFVVDFGRPEAEPGGLERDVADHVLAVSEAVAAVRDLTGRDVVLGGYSQGGMFCYQAAAYRRGDGVDSLITFGSPVDFAAAPLPIPISAESYRHLAEGLLSTGLANRISLPGWFNKTTTRLLDPIKDVQFRLQYLRQLHDREKLLPGEQQRMFLENEGWTAYAGPAFSDLLEHVFVTNRLLTGGLLVGDRSVSLADIDLPILTVVGELDQEGHPLAVRAIRQAAPRAEIYELTLQSGHFGIVAGNGARKRTWPRVAEWIRWRAGKGELGAGIVPADQVVPTSGLGPGTLSRRVQEVADLGIGVTYSAVQAAGGLAGTVYSMAREYTAQVPLLNRLEALRPETAVSLGLLLDEAAKRDPEATALMFGDRVVRQRELKHRVDSVVKGLVSVGVRPGDRVGVLMSSRPSGLSVIAAISRLGATAVLLRPDGDLAVEARVGGIRFAVSDPEHTPTARRLSAAPLEEVTWCVLGGGTGERTLPDRAIDLERVQPAGVPTPAWYRPNPTRATDVAFVLFDGAGEQTRARAITNRRWVLSALGTASAANLKPTHTVYSVTPLHHSSALLMAVGGAIAAGCRLALASDTDPDTFWAEVRRYGATHVSYTWTSLREVAYGPVHPNERHHPIQLFMGSGMPVNLWRRVNERFAPARVLEFYASTEGGVVLANVAGVRVGSVGRPLPGSARVRIAAYDGATGRPAFGPDGLARECAVGEPGLLLAEPDPSSAGASGSAVLRSVFTAGDAWQSTGDLFVKGREGDYWFVEHVDALVPTPAGPVSPSRAANALTRVGSVDLAVAYPVVERGKPPVVVAAVTLHPDAELGRWDLESALRRLPPEQWPQYVRVVDRIPLTTWSRPDPRPLRRHGLPKPGGSGTAWQRVADGTTYEPLT